MMAAFLAFPYSSRNFKKSEIYQMTSTTSVEKSISNVQMSLQIIDTHLQSVSIENCLSNPDITSLNKAKLNVSLAYTLNGLLYIYLKTQGVPPEDPRHLHVKQELERVKAFINRIKRVESGHAEPKMQLDQKASKRMIHSALSSDQVYVNAIKEKEFRELDDKEHNKSDATPVESSGRQLRKSKTTKSPNKTLEKSKRQRKA
uniref:Nuclear nucleic acid-binding protein C1D n=1 Tax=Albugo laibachii Nc14 TaxID=890382 RepID=F0W6V9_9STRA|nr:conserved hypothetical protein [Albugo laibachii Nc14]|eukprot:CCA16854.1 conserved hypothetical protein [Albugo laibachii Nc14]